MENQRYSWTGESMWTRPRTLRCSRVTCPRRGVLYFKLLLGLEERGTQVQEEEYQRGHRHGSWILPSHQKRVLIQLDQPEDSVLDVFKKYYEDGKGPGKAT
jgi:hypothetical protein